MDPDPDLFLLDPDPDQDPAFYEKAVKS